MFQFRVDGRAVRKSGFASRQEAQDALDAARAEALNPPPPADEEVTPLREMTLGEAFKQYFQVEARKRSLAEDQRIAKHLEAEFGRWTPLSALTASRIAEYRGRRLSTTSRTTGEKLSPAAVNRPLALLRHLLRLAHEEWEVLAAVPHIRLEKEGQGRLRWLTPEEAHRLLNACRASRNPGLADLVELALFTGMRQGELLGLTRDRVDRSRGVVRLEVTKSDRRREIPLNGPADAVLARRADTGKADGLVFGTRSWNGFRSAWERALVIAGLAGFRFHDLRHCFASWAIQRGATLPELQDLLGHASHAMVRRYAHLAPENLRRAVSRLDDVLALPAEVPASGDPVGTAPALGRAHAEHMTLPDDETGTSDSPKCPS